MSPPEGAGDQRQINLRDLAVGELPRELAMGSVIFRDHHRATRLLIEPVHDARTLMAADAGKVRAMMKQRVHQSMRLVASAGMNHQPGRLIEHEQVVVFVENPERNFLGLIGDRVDIRLNQPDD